MAYTPTEWQSGDIVTSAKLNKIEQGIADAGGGERNVVELSVGAQGYELITPLETVQSYVESGYADVTMSIGGQTTTIANCDIQASASKIYLRKLTLSAIAKDATPPTASFTIMSIGIGSDSSVTLDAGSGSLEVTFQS